MVDKGIMPEDLEPELATGNDGLSLRQGKLKRLVHWRRMHIGSESRLVLEEQEAARTLESLRRIR
jgi:hypothetical protein